MEKNKNLVIFDFCDTLINFQTWNAFLKWMYKEYYKKDNKEIFLVKLFKNYPLSIIFDYKRYLARQIKWIPITFINEKIEDFVKILNDNQNEKVVDMMKQNLAKWNEVVIVSAWFSDYIRIWAKQYWIINVYAIELEKNKWKYTWKYVWWLDVYWNNKLKVLKQNFNLSQYNNIIAYSDSLSDLPLFNVATKKYFVCKNSKIKVPKWFISINR